MEEGLLFQIRQGLSRLAGDHSTGMKEFNAFSWVLTCMFTFGRVMGAKISFRGTYTLEVNRND